MSLYQEWKNGLNGNNSNQSEREKFWKEYFETEKNAYQQILANNEQVIEGTVSELSNRFKMSPVIFLGFLDGISESLNEDLKDLDSYTEDSDVKLNINFEKLLFNMHKAKADWLYGLEEWSNIFTPDEQIEIADQYRRSRTIRKAPKIGRNQPCPCGSGKKYKQCCGRRKPISTTGTNNG